MITGVFLLDWALISASLFNTIVMLWLGLTVLLNAERRTWGVWLIEGGLLLGALFFVSHTIILGQQLTIFGPRQVNLWWQIGWIPVILAPLAWYIVILWYAGFWEGAPSRLRRRHQPWLILASGGSLSLVALMIFANPLPTYWQVASLDLSTTLTLGGVPLLFALYPAFVVLCILLPIDALRHPEPAQRLMGDLARARSRPWLIAASVMLLVVSLLVAVFMVWAVESAQVRSLSEIDTLVVRSVAIFDLLLTLLIAAATLLLGQAVVSYEVFTGKALPRRGFFRHWRNAILLAAGTAIPIGWSMVYQPLPVYSLLLATLLMATFSALLSWRSFVERERFFVQLRPFVSSQRLMQHLVGGGHNSRSRAGELFEAICRDTLGARQARLIPLGILAPLAGPPLIYPRSTVQEPYALPMRAFSSPPGAGILPLDPAQHRELRWAIPLWAERGLIGALLLGEKRDGGLYTQEEIEVARAGAERIVDMLAGEQMARRLMELQRRRGVETRVMDLKTRRALHDDVLPTLHAAALRLNSLSHNEPAVGEAIQALADVHRQIAALIHAPTPTAIPNGCNLLEALRIVVDQEFAGEFESVSWKVADELPSLEPLTQEVVFCAAREAVRNAAVHGRGERSERLLNLTLEIRHDDALSIAVKDDGVGLAFPLRFSEGPESEPPTGSGGGLALHSTMLAIVGGYLVVESTPDGGTQVVITLPLKPPSDSS